MSHVFQGGVLSPEQNSRIQQEITEGLAELKAIKVNCEITEEPSGDLLLEFAKGTTTQKIKLTAAEWKESGAIRKRIVEKLEL